MTSIRISLLISLSLISCALFAQNYTSFSCPLEVNGKVLKYPWTGGFNAPQFSSGDMDQDGKDELFVFDRAGQVPLVFDYEGNGGSRSYNHRPDLKLPLPDSLVSWALMRDYNRDGIPDLFVAPTYASISGVQLYVGSIEDDQIKFTIKKIGNPTSSNEIIWYRLGTTWINVTIPFIDIPEIVDIDGDSDLDILSFDLQGKFVTYYKNLQEEEGLPKDEMKFVGEDFCYGKFKESGVSAEIFLSDDPNDCAQKVQEDDPILKGGGAHSGSTIMCFDNDDDGDMEMLLGDLTGTNLVYLENGGSVDANHMTEVNYSWPSYDIPVYMKVFLGSFNVDIDGDGLKDILVSPNTEKKVQNVDNIWVYKNTGNTDSRFRLIRENFLLEETVDLGSLTNPVFMDENADGLMDLLVLSSGYFADSGNEVPFIYLYRNVGDKFNPNFQLVDTDFLSLSNFIDKDVMHASIGIGDIDNDGDTDILIGDSTGNLSLFSNSAGEGLPMSFGSPISNYMNINVGSRGRPTIVDLNNDGLNDIVIGERGLNSNFQDPDTTYFGSVAYYENQGGQNDPFFNPNLLELPNQPTLGHMRTQTGSDNFEPNSSAPHFFTVEGEMQVILGSESGIIKRYAVNQDEPGSKFILLDSLVGGINEGAFTTLSMYDIDYDGFLEVIIGNLRGGLGFYNTDIVSELSASKEEATPELVTVFPNPAHDMVRISLSKELKIEGMELYGIDGKMMKSIKGQHREIKLEGYTDGVYHLLIKTNKGTIAKKIVKL